MKWNKVFLLVFLIKAFKLIISKKCPFKIDECESCDININNITSLICSIENKVEGLFEKINFDIQFLNYSVYKMISIQNKNIKTLPNCLFKNLEIEILFLAKNEIEFISLNAFGAIKSIKTLDLSQNNLNSIETFELNNLTKLILSKNQLSCIKKILFKGLINLDYLMLDYNLIQIIEPDSFIDLNNLKYLYLDNNKIKHIENLAFSGLNMLDTLNLSYNYLEVINQNMFSMLHNLTVLILDSNIINSIDQAAFVYFKNLTTLSLNNNFLDCSNNFIEYLVNLEELKMENNRIKNFFHFSKNLKKLSFKSNYITSLKTGLVGLLTHLDLSSNRLTKLNNQDFQNLQNLNELLLNENKIAMIESDTFKYLINLKTLSLRQNYLLELKNYTFKFLGSLTILNLNNNSISSIYKETFSGLSKLEVLGLNDNYLSSLNDFVLDELI